MFGWRRDDDDPFAALRDQKPGATTHVGAPRPDPATLGHPEGEAAPRVAEAPRRRRNRRGTDATLALVTVALAFGGAAGLILMSKGDDGGASQQRSGGERSGSVDPGDRDPGGNGPGGKDPGGKDPGSGSRPTDFVRPVGLRDGLARVQGVLKPRERIAILRVARDRLNVSTALRDGRQRLIMVDDDLAVDVTTAGFAGARRGIPLDAIDVDGPARAVRAAARQGRMPARKLDYLVMVAPTIPGQVPDWSLFFKDVGQRNYMWKADLDGDHVHRPGEQNGSTTSSSTTTSSSGSVTIRSNGRTTRLTGADAERVMSCVRRAGTDAAKIQRCLP